jgi:ferrous iron transport protein A
VPDVPDASIAANVNLPADALKPLVEEVEVARLGSGRTGLSGEVVAIRARSTELERILLEIGFIEGARVEILHEGPFGRDPIAVRVDDMRVALRRREAEAVLIRAAGAGKTSGNACG